MTPDGYPEESELERIRTWEIVPPKDASRERVDANARALLEYLRERWRWPEYVTEEDGVYWVSTGGWSGHESMMEALGENRMFQFLCWQVNRRGGHFVFALPSARLEITVEVKREEG